MISDSKSHNRTIVHLDLDAFYCACERELNPSLNGKALAVSQYNPYGNLHETHSSQTDIRLVAAGGKKKLNADCNGSMIAVSYEARRHGVKRNDRGVDAISKCPDLNIVQVPVKRGKADLTMYRNASHRIMNQLIYAILNEFQIPNVEIQRCDVLVEKASIDEIYIDLTFPVDKMTEIILSLQKDMNSNSVEKKDFVGDYRWKLWQHLVELGTDLGSTTVGGIEVLSEAARKANQLSKNEVRKGSKFQVLETTLDEGSLSWWQRDIKTWTPIEIHLACGSALVAKARESVRLKFMHDGFDVFTLSAGISSNKTLAKLASGLKKPNRQTIINPSDEKALQSLFHPMPVSRLRGLGGKFGIEVKQRLNIETVGDLAKVPLTRIRSEYPPSVDDDKDISEYLYTIGRGICMEEVSERTAEKSMSSGKTFRNALALKANDEETIKKWMSELVGGLLERLDVDLEENNRMPSVLALSLKVDDKSTMTKSMKAPTELMHIHFLSHTMKLLKQYSLNKESKIYGMTVTASNFHEVATGNASITGFFQKVAPGTKVKSTPTRMKARVASPKAKRIKTFQNILDAFEEQGATRSPTKSKTSPMRCSTVKKSEGGKESHSSLAAAFAKSKKSQLDTEEDVKQDIIVSPDGQKPTKSEKSHDLDAEDEVKEKESTFINSDGLDTSVLSQLPLAIQSEIRVSKMKNIKVKKTDEKSPLQNWLSKSTKASTAKKKAKAAYKPRKLQQQKISIKSQKAVETKKFLPNSEEIDLSVVAELPFHIQAMIRKEMKMTARKKR
ncbi:hypothetical protein CTEN210_14717 [Chaetoceros tenuissimus]|uniref:DNA polymerase eta n=1 Tax=Chaetoceros tenuissimus TaxID=426638 RepID=A0AAD3D5I1_9STRA|nr:hypothetical protein CTEN210_14717 [Chaetoceros tenuissimus]